MKQQLNDLLASRNLDAILVTGPGQHNPPMVYLTGGGHLTQADLIQKRGAAPVLFYRPMERDEAARTGLATKNLDDYKYHELLKACSGNPIEATALRYKQMLTDAGVTSGRVTLYGQNDVGASFAIFSTLQRIMPELTLTGEVGDTLLFEAMMTKDEAEIARIRQMGKVTTAVVGQVADFLASQQAQDGVLVGKDGIPVTIGAVKRLINLWLAERGAENPEGTIFAQGYDAAIPHSTGNDEAALRLGQTIVFDIFPCEAGGGYFYDFTRTWCLGYAPDEALAIYEQVQQAYQLTINALRMNTPFKNYQRQVCEFFERHGHPSIKSAPQTQEGYVHSVGHGLGLHVHERPFSGLTSTSADILAPGSVFTVEPGLYYPARKLGVRLEDTVWMRPDGTAEVLVDYPMELLIPVK
ncbi:MAG: M24 family metallopeptidase [Chloroflexota bacterium]